MANKKYVDNSIRDNNILRFNQSSENYLKVSVGNDTYNLTKYNKIQIIHPTGIRSGNSGYGVLPNWKLICNDKNFNRKVTNFIKTTRSNSPTAQSGATSIPPIGKAFMYVEASGDNHGIIVFVSFKRTEIIQITNITF